MLAQAYMPHDPLLVLQVMVGLLTNLSLGFILMRCASSQPNFARWGSWSLLIISFSSFSLLCQDAPPGFRMLAIIGAVLFSMKTIVATEVSISGGPTLTLLQWTSWSGAWPGMAPELFTLLGRRSNHRLEAEDLINAHSGFPAQNHHQITSSDTALGFLKKGLIRLLIGGALLLIARQSWEITGSRIIATIFTLPGISLILHFGIFNLLAAFWKKLGLPTYSLFPAPLISRSLGEFWGKRWNLPFTEMIQRGVYRPLSRKVGRNCAATVGFLCSGLLHECAISHPVQQGYGLPLLYFLIHGVLVVIERSTSLGSWLSLRPALSRVWTLGWLVLPMPILFHPPFLEGVVWPLIGI